MLALSHSASVRWMRLVVARSSTWFFKKGKREDGFSELDLMLNTLTRNTKGFHGYISLLSHENPNVAVVVTLWSDEESLQASETGVFNNAVRKVKAYLEKPPKTENFRVFSAELRQ